MTPKQLKANVSRVQQWRRDNPEKYAASKVRDAAQLRARKAKAKKATKKTPKAK